MGLVPFAGELGRGVGLAADAVQGLSAIRGFETVDEGFALTEGTKPVYRVIRADEDPAQGLMAKDPSETKYTLEGHILNGGKASFRSRFISTSTDFRYLSAYAIRDNLRLVQIDLSKVVGKVYDLSTPEGRALYLRGATARGYAARASEVTIEGYVPSDAITIVQPAFAPRTYQP